MQKVTTTATTTSAVPLALLGVLMLSQVNGVADERRHGTGGEINWLNILPSTIDRIPLKEVGTIDLSHPVELRGFVDVPADYDRPDGPGLSIFYRLLPSEPDARSDRNRPILVIMNGGPGVPSSAYRSLDFEYGGVEIDSLSELTKYFRLVLVDQRGTGRSSPLDLDDQALSAEVIARYFDSDEHALDHGRVIDQLINPGDPFFILARSYGGEIGFKYLLFGDRLRQPAGMIFSSAILPHSDALHSFLRRREKQLELNLQLESEVPEAPEKLKRLRQHAEVLGLEPGEVNFLWADLGGAPGWEEELDAKLDSLLRLADPDALRSSLGGRIAASVNLLNYVLSSAALTPGFTDRTITRETSRRIPFEGWMLDENWTLNQLGRDGSWRECFIDAIDRNPPPPTHFPQAAAIRQSLSTVPVLFTFGTQDAFVPGRLQMERARNLSDPRSADFVLFEGGHDSAFTAEGAQVVGEWTREILETEKGDKQ